MRLKMLGWCRLLLVSAALVAMGGLRVAAAPRAEPPVAPAMLLMAAVREAAPAPHARRVFSTTTTAVQIWSTTVVLASSPDGRGALCTDDEVRVTVLREDEAVMRWNHQFWSRDRRAIVCAPAQRLPLPTGTGAYHVRVEVEDRYPPTFSTRAYYLVGATSPAAPPATRTLRGAVTVPVPDPERATITPQPTPSALAATASAAASLRGERDPAAPALTAVRHTVDTASAGAAQLVYARWVAYGGGALVGLLVGARLLRWRRQVPYPARPDTIIGIVSVSDRTTGEAYTAVLTATTPLLIQRAPLAVTLPAERVAERVVGEIQPGIAGPRLIDRTDGGAHSTPLRHAQPATMAGGTVTVRLRTTSVPPRIPPRGG